jgi:hypothetical protein
MSGADSLIINNRILADFADGNYGELTFPNEIASVKTGKNGNSIYALNETGRQSELKIRLIRGSSDDKFMNGLIANQQANFAGFVLMIGQLIKKIGDGLGNVGNDTYLMSGGIFTKQVEAKANAEGDSEQSVSIYTIKFSNNPRVIT